MASVTIYKTTGEKKDIVQLDDALFGVAVNPALVHEAVVAQKTNSRDAIAHTKTRADVAGGGRKPWKQKGTGRARHGSRRSPIWSGGGITFGPRNERNFRIKMNKKARRKALAMVLSDKVNEENLLGVEALNLEVGKTKALADIVQKLPVENKSVLIISLPEDKTVVRAAKNLANVSTLPANALNVVDLLKNDKVIITQEALDFVTKTYKRA